MTCPNRGCLEEGFRPNFGPPGWWLYAGDHPVLHISLKENIPPTRGATGSFDHIALNATGWRETTARLQRLGIPYQEQLVSDNTALQVFFRDSNGLRIELDYELDEAGA